MKYCFYLLAFIFLPGLSFGQDTAIAKVIAGPFAGSVTQTSAKVWLAY
jgi:hypothetical protein